MTQTHCLTKLDAFLSSTTKRSFLRTQASQIQFLRSFFLVSSAPLEDFPSELENLFRLSYLSLKNTQIESLPSSLGKLTNLETLNLIGTHVKELPTDILKLQRLRFLLGYALAFGGKLGVKLPVGTGSLTALDADSGSDVIEELKSLTRLRRLGITNIRKEDGLRLCAPVEKMEQLRSFEVASANEEELLEIKTLPSPPEFLERVYLKGRLHNIPSWISSLKSLEKLHLVGSGLRSDPLKLLQVLPILAELKLEQAYDGEFLGFKAKKFPRIKLLMLIGLSKLDRVTVEEEAMPSIQILQVIDRWKLREVGTIRDRTPHFLERDPR